MTDIKSLISASTLRLRKTEPFFATLLLFTEIKLDSTIKTAATDGLNIFLNSNYINDLTKAEFDAVILHELLHCALLHVSRMTKRNPLLWNYAADIVVNGQIRKCPHLALPEDSIFDITLEDYNTEEIYSILMQQGFDPDTVRFVIDLDASRHLLTDATFSETQKHWSNAFHHASAIARLSNKTRGIGSSYLGIIREFSEVLDAQLDWRQYLWRFMVATPTDYTSFDRRFIGEGVYLDAQDGESVNVYICIDTSGSISENELGQFMTEVSSIMSCYPHIHISLFYADSELYGPYTINDTLPKPKGGGGTDFVPFFDYIEINVNQHPAPVLIYLTDGYGGFPDITPETHVLWVIVAGGLKSDDFPFGETIRLI